MDDEDFDDLLAGAELLQDSSQESLINAASNLDFSCDESCQGDNLASSLTSASTVSRELPEQKDGLHCSTTENPSPQIGACLPMVIPAESTVIAQIEAIFEQMTDALLNERTELSLVLKRRARNAARKMALNKRTSVEYREITTTRISFPGKSAEEAWRFTVVTRLLELIHEALRTNTVLSKRDLYYRDPALFGSQARVDRYVDDIAFTFDTTRSMLNVTAAAKGLVAGALTFCRRHGSIVRASEDREGLLVPDLRDVLSVELAAVRWIIVIEKEATFRSIAASSFWTTLSTQGVILTGKGYPDISTRALLRYLSSASPQNGFRTPPVYGLADYDPDGLAILSTYKHGSIALAHENAGLCVPQLKWLGLKSTHILRGEEDTHKGQGLLPLTLKDRRKAKKMIERLASHNDLDLLGGLQVMLMLNVKGELQLLDTGHNGMVKLLEAELSGL